MVVHPTQIRRIYAVHQTIAEKMGFKADYQLAITDYKFDPNDPIDQKESIIELLRLVEWPSKGICKPQKDLPKDLIGYARDAVRSGIVKTDFIERGY